MRRGRGFPADLTSLALVLATQCKGTVLIHEKLFESRLFFVDRLLAMGARIVLCDPHRAVVIGPNRLNAAPDQLAGHPRRHGPDRGGAAAQGHDDDRQRAPGGPRVRGHRRQAGASERRPSPGRVTRRETEGARPRCYNPFGGPLGAAPGASLGHEHHGRVLRARRHRAHRDRLDRPGAFGSRLPKAARGFGQSIKEFKRGVREGSATPPTTPSPDRAQPGIPIDARRASAVAP